MWLLPILLITALLILLLVGIGLWKIRRKRTVIAARAWAQWERLPQITDPSRRVLEAENILDRVFRDIGYQGTFGEKLKRMQKILPNIDAVWHAHKLRNRIAHEPGAHIHEEAAQEAISVFEKALKTLLPPKKLRS